MQLFSIGNFITFFAVLLILVILRALDRNNRSLEKLKRFSDKIGANISALAEEKTAQYQEAHRRTPGKHCCRQGARGSGACR